MTEQRSTSYTKSGRTFTVGLTYAFEGAACKRAVAWIATARQRRKPIGPTSPAGLAATGSAFDFQTATSRRHSTAACCIWVRELDLVGT